MLTAQRPTAIVEPIPAEDPCGTRTEATSFATHVTRWSHIELGAPVPLVPRWNIRPGDMVMSSHGFAFLVTEIHRTRHPETGVANPTVGLRGSMHGPGGAPWSECYEGAIPLLTRGAVSYRPGRP